MIYWDTSALFKLYVKELDSKYFLDLVASSEPPIFTSSITSQEVLCSLYRKQSIGDLKNGSAERLYNRFTQDVSSGRITLITNNSQVISKSRELVTALYAHEGEDPLYLRSLDLIHLASALSIKTKKLVATDKRLREAAARMKLELFPK